MWNPPELRIGEYRDDVTLDYRPESWQGYVKCPCCDGGENFYDGKWHTCGVCCGAGKNYKHGPQIRTLRERLCFHKWTYQGDKRTMRFCCLCGLHQHKERYIAPYWRDIFDVRSMLPALNWWHALNKKEQGIAAKKCRCSSIGEGYTYGDIKIMYQKSRGLND